MVIRERFTIRAYIRNATNESGPYSRTLLNDGLNRPAYTSVVPLQPRTIGVAADISF